MQVKVKAVKGGGEDSAMIEVDPSIKVGKYVGTDHHHHHLHTYIHTGVRAQGHGRAKQFRRPC